MIYDRRDAEKRLWSKRAKSQTMRSTPGRSRTTWNMHSIAPTTATHKAQMEWDSSCESNPIRTKKTNLEIEDSDGLKSVWTGRWSSPTFFSGSHHFMNMTYTRDTKLTYKLMDLNWVAKRWPKIVSKSIDKSHFLTKYLHKNRDNMNFDSFNKSRTPVHKTRTHKWTKSMIDKVLSGTKAQ